MQCPKCAREFSPDVCYCEACSAMLEPVEIVSQQSGAGKDLRNSSGTVHTNEKEEILSDVKIDSLKTDIEQTFARTLLLELKQLRQRFVPGDNPAGAVEGAELQPGPGESNPADEIIRKRIAKLEAILFNLEKKIIADISDLETRLGVLKKPGLFALLTDKGRIYRMLTSELKIKYAVLDIIHSKHPPPSLESRLRPYSYALIAAVVLSAVSWTLFSLSVKKQTVPVTPPAASPAYTDKGESISRSDVIGLLEDIKKANLDKDPSLWESRYSKNYLALQEKKINIQKLWQNFDYTFLDYRIDGMNIQPSAASAQITWVIELRERKTGKILRSSELLSADFIREEKTLKISAIRKNGR
ncbi:MAG: hypothetical protein OEW04_04680 [Nitrospirota bacterium]|nr:hypothetical protein [Nitrospirota bacterium]